MWRPKVQPQSLTDLGQAPPGPWSTGQAGSPLHSCSRCAAGPPVGRAEPVCPGRCTDSLLSPGGGLPASQEPQPQTLVVKSLRPGLSLQGGCSGCQAPPLRHLPVLCVPKSPGGAGTWPAGPHLVPTPTPPTQAIPCPSQSWAGRQPFRCPPAEAGFLTCVPGHPPRLPPLQPDTCSAHIPSSQAPPPAQAPPAAAAPAPLPGPVCSLHARCAFGEHSVCSLTHREPGRKQTPKSASQWPLAFAEGRAGRDRPQRRPSACRGQHALGTRVGVGCEAGRQATPSSWRGQARPFGCPAGVSQAEQGRSPVRGPLAGPSALPPAFSGAPGPGRDPRPCSVYVEPTPPPIWAAPGAWGGLSATSAEGKTHCFPPLGTVTLSPCP